jgi:hypothetical protein
MQNIVEKYLSTSNVPVRSRGGSPILIKTKDYIITDEYFDDTSVITVKKGK